MAVGVSIGLGLLTEIEEIEIDSMDGLLLLEVLADDLVDGGVGDGEERRSETGGGAVDLGFEGFGEEGCEGGGVGDVEVEGVLDSEAVEKVVERRYDMKVVGGVGGGEEGGEEGGGGGGREGVTDEADVEGEGDGEGEEGVGPVGEGGRGGERAGEGGFEGGGERDEGVVGGLWVHPGLLGEEAVQSDDRNR